MVSSNVNNQTFLEAVFGGTAGAGDAHVTGFAEDPGTIEAQGLGFVWAGTKWRRWRDKAALEGMNAYFTISTFRDDPAGGRSYRRKSLFESCRAIVVDDVGPKVVDTSRLAPPTWRLETSPGNEQWGYVLAGDGERDAGRVTALVGGMIERGLASDGRDPGMKGVTRYVRLPVGRNTKAACGGGFATRLVEWEPGRVFDLDELAGPWGIALPAVGAGAGAGAGVPGRPTGAGMGVGAGDGDEVLGLLNRWGMLRGPMTGDGLGYQCVCPWEAEHTSGVGGAAYFPPDGVVCHHGHCEGKKRRELVNWAEARVQDESGGVAHVAEWNFDRVAGWVAAPRNRETVRPGGGGTGTGTGTGTGDGTDGALGGRGGARGNFFDDLVYVLPEDRFYDLWSGNLLTRGAVDFAWTRELVKVLPVVVPRTGEPMRPSVWFAHPDNRGRARMVDRLTYWPGAGRYVTGEDGASLVNRWVAAGRLAFSVTDADVAEWLRLVDLVCSRDGTGTRDSLLDWMAGVVGAPGVKPGWHVVVQGGHGLGKDLIAQGMIAGVGRSNVGTVNATGLGSAFNPWAERRLVQVNELKQNSSGTATGHDQYTRLKELTENTNEWIKINEKNRVEYYARNCAAYYATTNEVNAVALDDEDRRFMVVSAGALTDTPPWTRAEYAALAEWTAAGGAELVAEWLWQRWEGMDAARRGALLGRAPGSAGKVLMTEAAEDPVRAWMRERIETGVWPDLMTGRDVAEALAAEARTGASGFRYAPAPNRWGPVLRGLGGAQVFNHMPVRLRSGVSARLWAVRGPDRFAGMGAPQLAQAYISNAGHAFRDDTDDKNDKNVVSLTPR